ncbi:hypothetical protein D3C74_505910 [compost metagenome]
MSDQTRKQSCPIPHPATESIIQILLDHDDQVTPSPEPHRRSPDEVSQAIILLLVLHGSP